MTADELFTEAAERGLQLGRLFQTRYKMGDESRTDHWEAHFHTDKGVWCSGSGRSAKMALQQALYPTTQKALAKKPARLPLRNNSDLTFLD